ncbi:hypothetical protein M514_21600 [Trichuris suis]|uniref:Integrase catalytic domain-containing protein n=1 Tax=Trichuris suis TaxID=68888 RepID=A0A085NA17_9BILA|nr:hypothetical protein M514_21600 [Trichuris suis]
MCRELGITKTRTTPYHPSGNGQAERMNRTIWNMLAKSMGTDESDWGLLLPKVMMAYRSTTHATTGQAPYVMMPGRQCRMPEDITSRPSGTKLTPRRYVQHLDRVLNRLGDAVRNRTSRDAERQKSFYDLRARPQQFQIGDHVLLFSPRLHSGRKRKLRKPWTYPYVIPVKRSPVTYRVQHLRRKNDIQVVDEDRLKRCPNDLRPPTRCLTRSPRTPALPNSPEHKYCPPQASGSQAPQSVFLDGVDPTQPHPFAPGQPAIERPWRLLRQPAWFRDYVIDP